MSSQGHPELSAVTPGTIVMDSCGNYTTLPLAPPHGALAATAVCDETGYVSSTGGYTEVCLPPSVSDVSEVHVNHGSIGQTETGSSRCCYDNASTSYSSLKICDKPKGGNSFMESKSKIKTDETLSAVNLTGQFISGKKSDGKLDVMIEDVADSSVSKDNNLDGEDDASEGMDVDSGGDSGCPSECADLSPVSGPDSFTSSELIHSDVGESGSNTEQTCTEIAKPRGKRRYYMYGNHKLVKPIKEIPLRFQILLAETSAAKARCEGQPIYMQHPPQPQQPVHDIVYYQTNDGSQTQLNANASCFVPNQDGCGLDSNMQTAYVSDCFAGVSPSFSNPSASPSPSRGNQPTYTHAFQPTPLFVPPAVPPASSSTNTQNCSTIIVYSSHSSQTSGAPPPNHQVRTISVPPPPFPPPPNMPPPSLDHSTASSTPLHFPAGQTVRPVPPNQSSIKAEQQFKNVTFQPHQTNKPIGMLNVPPPNLQNPSPLSTSSLPPVMVSNTVAPSPGVVTSYSSPSYISVQPTLPALQHVSSPVMPTHHPSTHPTGTYAPVVSSNQYMYVYPSPPTGQPAASPHVVYMVSPAYPSAPTYQQQGVLVPLNCPVPVQ